MCDFYLPKVKSGIPKTQIRGVVLILRLQVFFTLYIIPVYFAEKEGLA